ncbi:hypothetical protein LXL04_002317 [Taraxacum kok-saghyz]
MKKLLQKELIYSREPENSPNFLYLPNRYFFQKTDFGTLQNFLNKKVVFSEFFFATGLVFERFLAPRSRFFEKGCLCVVLRTAHGWAIEIGTVNAQNVFRNNASHAGDLCEFDIKFFPLLAYKLDIKLIDGFGEEGKRRRKTHARSRELKSKRFEALSRSKERVEIAQVRSKASSTRLSPKGNLSKLSMVSPKGNLDKDMIWVFMEKVGRHRSKAGVD